MAAGAASFANETLGTAEENNIAAAAANAALDTLFICMIEALNCYRTWNRTQRYCCSPTETRSTRRLLPNCLSLCGIRRFANGRRSAPAAAAPIDRHADVARARRRESHSWTAHRRATPASHR